MELSYGNMCRKIEKKADLSLTPFLCRAPHIDSQVDWTFLIEVFLFSAAKKFFRAVRHEQLPPKFSSNTCLAKGMLCPEKSIRSIKSSTVR
jgi:hypothetical protein